MTSPQLTDEWKARIAAGLRRHERSAAHRASISAVHLVREERAFWAKVDKSGDCWEWLGKREDGYGRARFGRERLAHRVAYLRNGRTIPDGLTLDHLCRNRGCVNPDHLEPVTAGENTRRGAGTGQALYIPRTHCKHGHPYADGVYLHKGVRHCGTCRATRKRAA